MGWIYLIRNIVNNKCYIGQTRAAKVEKRWISEKSRPHGLLKRAFEKYGMSNFTFEIISEVSNDELDEREKLEIISRNTLAPNGYNLESGGNSRKIVHVNTREKLRLLRTGSKASVETRQKMSVSRTGMKQSLDTKLKRGKTQTGEKNHMFGKPGSGSKKVGMFIDGVLVETYDSIKSASRSNNISSSSMSLYCNGIRKPSGNFTWKFI
jgi:group I intron endonuclease